VRRYKRFYESQPVEPRGELLIPPHASPRSRSHHLILPRRRRSQAL